MKIKVSAYLAFPGGSEGEPTPCVYPESWWWLATRGVSWLTDTSLQSQPPSSHAFFLSVSVSNLLLLSRIRTPVGKCRAHPYSGGSHPEILNLMLSAKTIFPSKVPFTGPEHIFGDTILSTPSSNLVKFY